jgi:hypothetical protein
MLAALNSEMVGIKDGKENSKGLKITERKINSHVIILIT